MPDNLKAEVTTFRRPWRNHVVMRSRRQRKSGNVIFQSEWRAEGGCSYLEFKNPVHAAEHAFAMLGGGCTVTWDDTPAKAPHS